MLCPKCKTDRARRSRRHGLFELVASFVAVYPYRCRNCGHRFFKFRFRAPDRDEDPATIREVLTSGRSTAWRRKRLEFLVYGAGMLLFLIFLYYITREHGGSPDGG